MVLAGLYSQTEDIGSENLDLDSLLASESGIPIKVLPENKDKVRHFLNPKVSE
jgi:hypothetical protein